MSDRERWTVYPLLFLAIGLSMRAVLVPPAELGDVDAVRLVCREIMVRDEDGTVMLHLGRITDGGGRLEINYRDGNALMAIGSLRADAEPRAGIEFSDSDGTVVRRLTTDPGDGP